MSERVFNSKIVKAGLRYIGHTDSIEVMVCGPDWNITLPFHRVRELVEIFGFENFDNPVWLQDIKGKYVRVIEKDGRIIGLMNILYDDDVYMVSEAAGRK